MASVRFLKAARDLFLELDNVFHKRVAQGYTAEKGKPDEDVGARLWDVGRRAAEGAHLLPAAQRIDEEDVCAAVRERRCPPERLEIKTPDVKKTSR